MTDSMRVNLIRPSLTTDDACSMLASLDSPGYALERTLQYPYHFFEVSGSAPSLFGRRPLSIGCLVDARTGDASTADRFETQSAEVAPASLMAFSRCSRDAAWHVRRYAAHALARGLRTVANFNLRVDHTTLVYKTFWVFTRNGRRMLVDSTTGSVHPLADYTVGTAAI